MLQGFFFTQLKSFRNIMLKFELKGFEHKGLIISLIKNFFNRTNRKQQNKYFLKVKKLKTKSH